MWRVKPSEDHGYEAVSVSGEGQFFLAVDGGLVFLRPDQVHEVCDVCEEVPTADDPLGHFKGEVVGTYVLTHGQCGLDQGLELA